MKKRRRAYKKYDWKSHKILMPRRYDEHFGKKYTDRFYDLLQRGKMNIRISQNRILVRYWEDGGDREAGLILLNDKLADEYLGTYVYAAVVLDILERGLCKGGIAQRGNPEDFTDDYDLIFYTFQKRGTPLEKVFKKIPESLWWDLTAWNTTKEDYKAREILADIANSPNDANNILENLMNKELKEAFIKAGLFESINVGRENCEHIN